MTGITVPAPVGGWNAISALSEMPATDAIELVNIIPSASECTTRYGFSGLPASVTPNTTPVYTLAPFIGASGVEKLVVGVDGALGLLADGATTYVEQTGSGFPSFLSDEWQHTLHTASGTTRIILLNGADTPRVYDGSAFSELSVTGPADTIRGDEEVVNGDFDTDTDWTEGAGWAIGAGVAAATASSASLQSTTAGLTPYRKYEVIFTVSGIAGGSVRANVGGTLGTVRSTDATFTETIECGAATTFKFDATGLTANIDDVSVKAYLPYSDLLGAVTFKGRVIYWENASPSFWFAAAGAYSGSLTEFTVNQFTKGGYVQAIYNWTRDGGAGMEDHLVVLMSTGEVIIYQGSDPADANDWAMVGVYQIGKPIGKRPATQVGGDLVILTEDGYAVLSAAITEGRYSENSLFSQKINNAARKAAQDYGTVTGWGCTLFPSASLFVVNVPISSTESLQHVRHTTSGQWCSFSGINAKSLAVMGGKLYFGGTNGEVLLYGGASDDGAYIEFHAQQAFQTYGNPHKNKQLTSVEALTTYQYPQYIDNRFAVDFDAPVLPALTDPPEGTAAVWDVSDWDSGQWGVLGTEVKRSRRNAQAFGRFVSHTMRWRSRKQITRWHATNYTLKTGGYL